MKMEQLYKEHSDRVYSYIYFLVRHGESAAATQDTRMFDSRNILYFGLDRGKSKDENDTST